MEFQALKVLPIALDMRSIDHMMYTPAPDIVHEAAGHAPFIVDVDYAEFLQRFGEVGMKAIASRHDMETYEAIRRLSIVKELASSSEADIAQAEADLRRVSAEDVRQVIIYTYMGWIGLEIMLAFLGVRRWSFPLRLRSQHGQIDRRARA